MALSLNTQMQQVSTFARADHITCMLTCTTCIDKLQMNGKFYRANKFDYGREIME